MNNLSNQVIQQVSRFWRVGEHDSLTWVKLSFLLWIKQHALTCHETPSQTPVSPSCKSHATSMEHSWQRVICSHTKVCNHLGADKLHFFSLYCVSVRDKFGTSWSTQYVLQKLQMQPPMTSDFFYLLSLVSQCVSNQKVVSKCREWYASGWLLRSL